MPEPTEIQQQARELQEATERGGEPLRRISLAISILAVLVAVVTVLGHRSNTEAILMESRASDQWNEYQAKKIRMENLSVTTDLMRIRPDADAPAVKTKTDEYSAHIEKWKADLADAQEKAHEYEQEASHAEARASRYELGEAMLQIAVVLASITLFTRNRKFFGLGLLLGSAGLIIAASAQFIR